MFTSFYGIKNAEYFGATREGQKEGIVCTNMHMYLYLSG